MSDAFVTGFFVGLLVAAGAAFIIYAAMRRSERNDEADLIAWDDDYSLHHHEPQVNSINTRIRKIEL